MDLISKAEFSKRLGVSRAAVTKLCKGQLAGAVVSGKINLDSEAVAQYVQSREKRTLSRVDISNPGASVSGKDDGGQERSAVKADEDVEQFEHMTLSQLCEIFGTDERFKVWLAGRKVITEIKTKELKLAQEQGKLVARKLVEDWVIGAFNEAHMKIMKDGAKSIAAGAIAKHSSGAEVNEVEAYVSDIMGSFIKPVKATVARVLKNAGA